MRAFPRSAFYPADITNRSFGFHNSDQEGMELRDYFAIRFAVALANLRYRTDSEICVEAYGMADAMMKARKS